MFWRLLGPVAVAANLVLWAWLLGAGEALRRQALVAGLVLVGAGLVSALIREVLSPKNAELRLVPVPDHRAQRLSAILGAVVYVLLFTELAIYLVRTNGWSESVASLLALLRTCGVILFAWSALGRSGLLARLRPADTHRYRSLLLWLFLRVVLPLGVLTTLFCVVATALGYRALSAWVLRSAGWTAALVLATALVYRLVRRRLHATIAFIRDESVAEGEGGSLEAPWWIGVERVVGGTLQLLVAVGVITVLLSIWNVGLDDVGHWLGRPILAGGELTWGAFLGGIAKAAVIFVLHALLRNVLIFIVFPRTAIESGARYAMLTVMRYGAWVLILLFLLGALGMDTSTLTVFAGGATVGLAFGLKDIFSNFFSGLIMLLERPVRVGDTIEVGGVLGKIEAIRLRGTTIRTFEGTIVIVPNTQMIGERLSNLSYSLRTARMQVDVGVSYDEDPRKVEKVLLRVARADPRVVDDPAPVVRFNNFGDSSLDFCLRVWTHDVEDRWALVSDLRRAVFEAFRKEGIEIPFPQRDLHVRSGLPAPGGPAS
jgi:small-conductance mechanosensitive channel